MIYEFRIYETLPGRAHAFAQRFHTFNPHIFERYGMQLVGTWFPADHPDNQFAYMLAFESEEHRQRAWQQFSQDEEWRSFYDHEKRTNQLFNRALFDVVMMPADFSVPMEG